jgi:hypothetical protein
MHYYDALPVVLAVGRIDPHMLIAIVEAGVRAVVRRCEVTPQRLSQLLHATAAENGERAYDPIIPAEPHARRCPCH